MTDAQAIRREILGEDEEEDESDDDEDGDSEDESSDEEGAGGAAVPGGATQKIQDNTETNLINLRRTIYLTIMSALDFEEAGHKLMKIQLAPGQEQEIVTMVIECCSQEKTYSKCVTCPLSSLQSLLSGDDRRLSEPRSYMVLALHQISA